MLMLLISTYQAIHAIGHFLDHQDNNTKEYTHFSEHKCSLCHINSTPLLPEVNVLSFEWNEIHVPQEETNLVLSRYQSTIFGITQLRAPPVEM